MRDFIRRKRVGAVAAALATMAIIRSGRRRRSLGTTREHLGERWTHARFAQNSEQWIGLPLHYLFAAISVDIG